MGHVVGGLKGWYLSMSVHSKLVCTLLQTLCCCCLVWWCFICPIGAKLDQGVDLEGWLDLSMNYLCVYLFAERLLGYFSCLEVFSQKWVFPHCGFFP